MNPYRLTRLTCLATLCILAGCTDPPSVPFMTLQTDAGTDNITLTNCNTTGNIYLTIGEEHDAVNVALESHNRDAVSIESKSPLAFGKRDNFQTISIKCVGSTSSDNVITATAEVNGKTHSSQFMVHCLDSGEGPCPPPKCDNDPATCCQAGNCCQAVTCGPCSNDPSCCITGNCCPYVECIDCNAYPSCLNYAQCNSSNGCVDRPFGVIMSTLSGLTTTEDGGTASFQIKLKSKPKANVVITFESNDESEGVVANPIVTFTPENWDTLQTVTIRGIDDDESDGDITYRIVTKSVVSTDTDYNNLAIASVYVTNLDNDAPDCDPHLIVENMNFQPPTNLELWETGVSQTLRVYLDCKPMNDVIVTPISTDANELRVTSEPLTFTKLNFGIAQYVKIKGVPDNEVDGDQTASLDFKFESEDARYNDFKVSPLPVTIHDTDTPTSGPVTIRMMAANITTGNYQSYDDGEGKRIFQAMRPDIVMIQEFNMHSGTIDGFVSETFGPHYDYYRGTGDIPNGIISRYPIIEHGQWRSPSISNRGFNYAVIDLPGDKNLLAVSVHISTDTKKQGEELTSLASQIQSKASDHYIVLGGDFNTKQESTCTDSDLKDIFEMHTPWPADQNGNTSTNANRDHHYDWLLSSPDLHKLETPVVIGEHTYPNGHVFDSRVYAKKCTTHEGVNELTDVPPVLQTDSADEFMQHMAVIRDFHLP